MIASGCTLDTSVLILLSRGWIPDAELDLWPSRVCLSHVAAGEFLAGVREPSHRRSEAAARWFAGFRKNAEVLSGTTSTATVYARLHHHTRRRGKPIPANDLWIAATAAEHGLPLLSRDAHFDGLPGVEHRRIGAA